MRFQDAADVVAKWAGSGYAFLWAAGAIAVWIVTGPIFHFSDTWQLVINTGTTIVTFLMVFLIQNSANRSNLAVMTKLDELLRVDEKSRNELIGLERRSEREIEEAAREVERLAGEVGNDQNDHTGVRVR